MNFTLEAPNMHRRLHELGVGIVTSHHAPAIEPGGQPSPTTSSTEP